MSATLIYAALLILMMSLVSGCARTVTNPEARRARINCRGAPVDKRAGPWTPPRVRL